MSHYFFTSWPALQSASCVLFKISIIGVVFLLNATGVDEVSVLGSSGNHIRVIVSYGSLRVG